MKKWQEWLIVAVVGLVLVVGIGATYWFLAAEDATETSNQTQTVTRTEEDKDLTDIEDDLEELDDLDLSELDSIEEDLDSIDLSELE